MKRIILTSVLERYATEFLKDLKALKDKPEDRLESLKKILASSYPTEAAYVNDIIAHYDEIIMAKPDEMVTIINSLFAGYSSLDLSKSITCDMLDADGNTKSVTKKFYQWVTEGMGYDDVQEKVFPMYIKKMGIKSCVYCNSQYAVSSKRGRTNKAITHISTYTIDHYQPKSKYPYLATSFFNLYPCCSTCNQFKSSKPPIFNLYVQPLNPKVERNPFAFHLDSYSFIRYSMSGDADDLNVSLITRSGVSSQELKDYEDYFHISKLYSNYRDTVEEVIWKYRMYNRAGRKALYASYSHLLPRTADFNRFILGNYDREEDMLKRPLSKVVQDVAKELGIL